MNFLFPFLGDDYFYHFFYEGENIKSLKAVQNISDLFISQWNHYQEVNGRFVTHLIVQLFCAILGKSSFNIFNTFIFGCLIIATRYVLTTKYKQKNSFVLLLVIGYYFVLSAQPGSTMLWLSGSVNYMWATLNAIIFTLLFEQYIEKEKELPFPSILGFPIGFLLAQTHELVAIGIGATLGTWYLFNLSKLRKSSFLLSSGFIFGALTVVFSPGSWKRAANDVNINNPFTEIIGNHFIYLAVICIKTILPVVLLLLMLYFLYNKGVKTFCLFFKNEFFISGVIVFNLLFLFTIGAADIRALYICSVFSFLLCCRIWQYMAIDISSKLKTTVVLSAIFCALLITGKNMKSLILFSQQYNSAIAQTLANGEDSVVAIPNIETNRGFLPFATFLDSYKYHSSNLYLSGYYHKKSTQFIPTQLFEAIKNGDLICDTQTQIGKTMDESNQSLYFNQQGNFFYLPITPYKLATQKVKVTYHKKDKDAEYKLIPFYRKIIRSVAGNLMTYEDNYFSFEKEGKYFLIFPAMENLKSIEIPYKADDIEKSWHFKLLSEGL